MLTSFGYVFINLFEMIPLEKAQGHPPCRRMVLPPKSRPGLPGGRSRGGPRDSDLTRLQDPWEELADCVPVKAKCCTRQVDRQNEKARV